MNTGHIYSEAGKFCIRTQPKYDWNWPWNMISGETYTLELAVQNECGNSDIDALNFILPVACNPYGDNDDNDDDGEFKISGFSPNPTSGILTGIVNAKTKGEMKFYGAYSSTLTQYGLLTAINVSAGEVVSVNLDASNFISGVNSIIIEMNGYLESVQIIKQ